MNPNDPNTSDEAFMALAFRELESVEPSAALLRRVAEVPARNPVATLGFWPFGRLAPLLFGLAGAAMLGLLAGGVAPSLLESGTFVDAAASTEALDAELGLVSELDWTDGSEETFALLGGGSRDFGESP